MNDNTLAAICGVGVGVFIGFAIWGGPQDPIKEGIESHPQILQCIAGPHPQNPEYVQLECEITN